MKPVKNKLRVVHFPQIGSSKKAFTIEVKDEEQAYFAITTLAKQHLWLEKNNFIPDYANSLFVEMWDENSDGEGNAGWCDYYNEEEFFEWSDVEEYFAEKANG